MTPIKKGSLQLWSGSDYLHAAGHRATESVDDSVVLAGALPFTPGAEPILFEAERFERRTWSADDVPSNRAPIVRPGGRASVQPLPTRATYGRLVREVTERLQKARAEDGALRKVVLARRLDVEVERSIDPARLAHLLRRDPSVTTFLLETLGEVGGLQEHWVGASPELLVEKRGASVTSGPLAGSARRSADPGQDRRAAEALQSSQKDLEEHRLVVEYVLDTLAPLCSELSSPDAPKLTSTATMWHLKTDVGGCLKDRDLPVLDLARRLHPTPAVCGVPSGLSAQMIDELEPFDRRVYGGAVGWSDAQGDGRWVVALRCARVIDRVASLYAGAGIVIDSKPESECDETSAKFRALLSAFGIEESSTERSLAGHA
ncbi:MAG: isochorismate synthase [Gemmatimonadota bacterium]